MSSSMNDATYEKMHGCAVVAMLLLRLALLFMVACFCMVLDCMDWKKAVLVLYTSWTQYGHNMYMFSWKPPRWCDKSEKSSACAMNDSTCEKMMQRGVVGCHVTSAARVLCTLQPAARVLCCMFLFETPFWDMGLKTRLGRYSFSFFLSRFFFFGKHDALLQFSFHFCFVMSTYTAIVVFFCCMF